VITRRPAPRHGARPVVDKNKHKKMTDHVAEQIELKLKAATVPQPPTEPICKTYGAGISPRYPPRGATGAVLHPTRQENAVLTQGA
jgi:hypothetical protein